MRTALGVLLAFVAVSLFAQEAPERRPLIALPNVGSLCGGLECSNTRATSSEILVPCAREDENGNIVGTTVSCSTASCVYAPPKQGADGLCQGTDCYLYPRTCCVWPDGHTSGTGSTGFTLICSERTQC
jgi:hypothetical protein